MTREQFAEKWKHEWGGMLLDAATRRLAGPELSLWMQTLMAKVEANVSRMYDDAQQTQPQAIGKPPPPPAAPQPPANGSHGEPEKRRAASGGMGGILKQ